ncbi:hypothetical protein O9929_14600 [Vibrio lentus]|nr:hypothetical protein [Vibrio lentus]
MILRRSSVNCRFLFKILAAEKALSVQVHPNKRQAEIGFARERSKQESPLTTGHRNYKDSEPQT